jgi:hypothetical protein
MRIRRQKLFSDAFKGMKQCFRLLFRKLFDLVWWVTEARPPPQMLILSWFMFIDDSRIESREEGLMEENLNRMG